MKTRKYVSSPLSGTGIADRGRTVITYGSNRIPVPNNQRYGDNKFCPHNIESEIIYF